MMKKVETAIETVIFQSRWLMALFYLGVSIALVLLIALGAAPALACSCRCPADTAAFVREVPVFFRGRALDNLVAGGERRFEFEVTAVYKGDLEARVLVRTATVSAACGANFPLDRESLVGARLGPDGLQANLCTQYCIQQKQAEIEQLLAQCAPGGPCPPDH